MPTILLKRRVLLDQDLVVKPTKRTSRTRLKPSRKLPERLRRPRRRLKL